VVQNKAPRHDKTTSHEMKQQSLEIAKQETKHQSMVK
jgi:hypothetical protein